MSEGNKENFPCRERLSVLEALISGKEGLVDRIVHLDKCMDALKRSVWMAAGGIAVVMTVLHFVK